MKSSLVSLIATILILLGGNSSLWAGPDVRSAGETAEESAGARPGLLILSHGAPRDQWNQPVLALVDKVRRLNEGQRAFHAVEAAFLEFAQPDAASAVDALNAAGCDRIIVVPLFIAPSTHSHFDMPAVLGLFSSPALLRTLDQEGVRVARSKAPLVVAQTLDEGDLLDRFACDEVRALSQSPPSEAVVLIAHGCPDHSGLVERMMRRVVTYCCGRLGIDYGDWAFCEVGQSFRQEAVPAIVRAAEHKKRVLVVGLYVSSSAAGIAENALGKTPEAAAAGMDGGAPFQGIDVVFSTKGVVGHPGAAAALFETALGVLRGNR